MNTDPSALIGSVAPILVLIVLGALLARTSVLDDATVAGLKRIIVNVALPAVLFTTFLKTRFEPEHLWLVLLVFGLCVALLTLGRVLPVGPPSRYRPFLFTGFELGMMGFALFAAGFGAATTLLGGAQQYSKFRAGQRAGQHGGRLRLIGREQQRLERAQQLEMIGHC